MWQRMRPRIWSATLLKPINGSKCSPGNIDVVSGPKGAGKSALYTLLNKKENELFDKQILIASAENVRGATAFQSIITDPPTSERSFIYIWKLYCLTLIAKNLREFEVKNEAAESIVSSLETAKLLPATTTLSTLFRGVSNYLQGWIKRDAKSVEYGLTIDPTTGTPTATRKIEFAEKTEDQTLGDLPVDELLAAADQALKQEGLTLWILFDRLDVLHSQRPPI